LESALNQGFVRVSKSKNNFQPYNFQYVTAPSIKKVSRGEYRVSGTRDDGSKIVVIPDGRATRASTSWRKTTHDANSYGSQLIGAILPNQKFPFPKSIYSVFDVLKLFAASKKNALIIDFFAGSGTTLHAVNLLNAIDDGMRRCILVTNNEVSAEEADGLRTMGLQPGDVEWEELGICRSVTWPRSKFTILGRRNDGTLLTGDYLTGRTVDKEKSRSFSQIGFVNAADVDTVAKKKQVVALIDGLPQTLVKDPCPFIVSDDHKASVLFDVSAADDWLQALDGQEHITNFYIVTTTKRVFDALKEKVEEQLGPNLVPEEEKRPMGEGFPANLAYFKLEFLDKDRVALKQAFREVLPILWLKAGAIGRRPELPRSSVEPAFFDPGGTNFAVLLDEGAFGKFVRAIAKRTGLSVVYIVTDADEAFKDMADEVRQALRLDSPSVEVVQLYKDYLANFLINTRLDHGLNGQGGQA
jgi:adenine-specific DNA-methyltransferase